MTPNSLAVLKSGILDENYLTVTHVPLSTPVENTFFCNAILFFLQMVNLTVFKEAMIFAVTNAI